jgi:hypothetical protein
MHPAYGLCSDTAHVSCPDYLLPAAEMAAVERIWREIKVLPPYERVPPANKYHHVLGEPHMCMCMSIFQLHIPITPANQQSTYENGLEHVVQGNLSRTFSQEVP